MESAIIQLEKAFADGVLERSHFGRTREVGAWVKPSSLPKMASFLKERLSMDWLENLSVIQTEETLVFTYFIRSTEILANTLILRASLALTGANREVDFPSVSEAWAMAVPFEIESGELFGVRFTDGDGKRAYPPNQRLPKDWNGYPLRKNYVFPTEFLGIRHSRPKEAEKA